MLKSQNITIKFIIAGPLPRHLPGSARPRPILLPTDRGTQQYNKDRQWSRKPNGLVILFGSF